MMSRWGLNGMQSFEQVGVAKKEAERLAEKAAASTSTAKTTASLA